MTEQETFALLLASKPPTLSDAVIFLCGEDTIPRLDMLKDIANLGARINHPTQVILTGGLHTPPRRISAGELMSDAMGVGVAYNMLTLENASQNTREQALAVIPMLVERGWLRVILLTPAYHIYRAYLTFLQALIEMGLDRDIHLVGGPDRHSSWLECPAGLDMNRLELLVQEFEKIDEYRAHGHVASYAAGIEYLQFWDGK